MRDSTEIVYVDLHKVFKSLALISKRKTYSLGGFKLRRYPSSIHTSYVLIYGVISALR